ncbi:MAG: hypothetical protein QM501_05490 [Gimesia sp.]
MSTRSLFNICCCTLLSSVFSGCYSHHQSPYGGNYPGPYGAPAPYQMAPTTLPPGAYQVQPSLGQPNLGQPVPPPQGAFQGTGSQTYNDAFPNNTNNTNYDGVDSKWTQPTTNSPNVGNNNETPFGANPTASGNNANLGSGVNSNSFGDNSVPTYSDPNDTLKPNNQFLENKDPFPSTPQNSFEGNKVDQFESNKAPQPFGGNSTEMDNQFGPNTTSPNTASPKSTGNDQFQSNPNDQFQQNDNEGFSIPEPVKQQNFEVESGENDTFNANPNKFNPNPNDTFKANPVEENMDFQPPVNNTPSDGDLFGPNSSSRMNPASNLVSHANHQTRMSGPQLVKTDPFLTPAKFQTASFGLPAGFSNQTSITKSPSPFSYDKQRYGWLRGVIEFDEQEKHWNITYNATPDKTDKFGGNIVLLDQGKLNHFKNGDVVLIDGKIDSSQQDRMGKPYYLISKIQKLVPKK